MLLTDCRDDRVTLNKNDAMTREQLNALIQQRNISVESIPVFDHIFAPSDLNGLKLASKGTAVPLRPRDNHAVARWARMINDCLLATAWLSLFSKTRPPSLSLGYKQLSGSNVDSWGLRSNFHQWWAPPNKSFIWRLVFYRRKVLWCCTCFLQRVLSLRPHLLLRALPSFHLSLRDKLGAATGASVGSTNGSFANRVQGKVGDDWRLVNNGICILHKKKKTI